jgi:site-specific DNA-methyltransferase (adenine-specific)
MAFGGTRTWHRLAVAIENSGWEIRDNLCWLYGSGFPKSLSISKAIDKAAGAEREVVGSRPTAAGQGGTGAANYTPGLPEVDITVPATEAAKLWDGYGTALKPAWEGIILARKPLDGTNANNALTHGCGGLWIDGGRIGTEATIRNSNAGTNGDGWGMGATGNINGSPSGRWPANVILDPEAADLLDAQSGELKSGDRAPGVRKGIGYMGGNGDGGPAIAGDSGGASRFFYVAKPSKHERNAGLTGPGAQRDPSRNADQPSMHGGKGNPYNRGAAPVRNSHPTVKPVALLRHLLRLTRPPGGGLVLDNFCGSGSTGIAAVLEGRDFVGVDLSSEYCAIAEARIAHAKANPRDYDPEDRPAKAPPVLPGQQDLF